MCESLGLAIKSISLHYLKLLNSKKLTKNATVYVEMHLCKIQAEYHFYVLNIQINLIVGCDFMQEYRGSVNITRAKLVLFLLFFTFTVKLNHVSIAFNK